MLSHFFIGGSKAKFLVIVFLLLFILGNIINLMFKYVSITDDFIEIGSLGGKRKINFNDICEVSPLKLKGRYIFIISDQNNYGFLSSMFGNFDEIYQILGSKISDAAAKNIKSISPGDFHKKKRIFVLFLVLANIFLFLASCYNFFTG